MSKSLTTPSFEWLVNPALERIARTQLAHTGSLLQDLQTGYVFLKVDDDYIHRLFPLLDESTKQVPNYFLGPQPLGAHISVIYPEEIDKSQRFETTGTYSFEIERLFKSKLGKKTYLGLTVRCKELEELRRQSGLNMPLNFRGYLVPFHITIGVSSISNF